MKPEPVPVALVARPAEGGIRAHILQLLTHLDRERFALCLVAPRRFLEGLPPDLPHYTPVIAPIGARTGPADLVAAAVIRRTATQARGIVHAHGVRAGFVCAVASIARPFPLVVTYHNLAGVSRAELAARRVIRRRCAATIAVSEAVAKGLGQPNCHVIPNGIDVAKFAAASHASARRALGVGETEILVACVARLSREKGVDLLLRCAALLPDLRFLIAGSGPERDRLELGAPANVRFLGAIDDSATLFAAADIAAIPSRSEGQGIVALEAMAAGAAVVAANVGGLGETIEDGKTGLLVAPESPTELAAAIGKLSGDAALRGPILEAASRWVRTHGDTYARIREIEAVYEAASTGRADSTQGPDAQ